MHDLKSIDISLISPYHSGSHQAWAEGYAARSQHRIALLTMPGQLWKWRMHGAAVTLARQFNAAPTRPDLILADDMLDLATFLALTRRKSAHIPAVLYMHENQLTYPIHTDKAKGPMRRNLGVRERQYVLINWKAQLAADQIWFNSGYHREIWFQELPIFLKHYPNYSEIGTVDQLVSKSQVVPVGVQLTGSTASLDTKDGSVPPLILWNQRWEFDKNPTLFFEALTHIKEKGVPFRLAICGERFQNSAESFDQARETFENELVHFGYADRTTYRSLLQAADLTISTAHHEFFGISIIEAIAHGAFPILPNRLNYPAVIPEQYHSDCLYNGHIEPLVQRTIWALTHPTERKHISAELSKSVQKFDWPAVALQMDQRLREIASFLGG